MTIRLSTCWSRTRVSPDNFQLSRDGNLPRASSRGPTGLARLAPPS
ncbi:MAG: hypothetical protein CM1200mP2_20010 [Planctomycetaceae bacterium]|nr:MAG: hypothetical protein CM1200mP2_20010 [Planctomycetaceae bacterium]